MSFAFQSFASRFARDERGVVAVLFGLIFVMLVILSGIAVDQSRIYHSTSKLAAAADAAALAAGRAMLDRRNTDDEVKQIGQRFFDENLAVTRDFANVHGVRIIPNRVAGTVTVDVDADVPVTITKVAGFESVLTPVKSSTAYDQRDIELGMALDVTGSMSGSKIANLKLAAKDLIDILIPDSGSTNTVRIGLAPYAAGVNAGSYARMVTNDRSTRCVHERAGSEAYTDYAPGTGSWIGFTSGMNCPSARVEPLTNNKGTLKSRIDTYSASGMTAGHIGAAWAWYLVSPEWASIWPTSSRPVSYSEPNTVKAIILMTDGEFNTQYVSGNGNSSSQALNLCEEMKDKDVVVYSVAFQSPTSAANLLRSCATSEDTFFNANDGDELRAAFQSIAANLNNLRLTQ